MSRRGDGGFFGTATERRGYNEDGGCANCSRLARSRRGDGGFFGTATERRGYNEDGGCANCSRLARSRRRDGGFFGTATERRGYSYHSGDGASYGGFYSRRVTRVNGCARHDRFRCSAVNE